MNTLLKNILLGLIIGLALWLGIRCAELWNKHNRVESSLQGAHFDSHFIESVLGVTIDDLKQHESYFFGLIYNPMACDCSVGRIREDLAMIETLMGERNHQFEVKVFFLGNQEKLGNLLVNEINTSFTGLSSYRDLDSTRVNLLPRNIGDGMLLVLRPDEKKEGTAYTSGILFQTDTYRERIF